MGIDIPGKSASLRFLLNHYGGKPTKCSGIDQCTYEA